MKPEDLLQEIRDNKSHFLVTLLDFCDQVKNQVRDSYYRSRIDMLLTDLNGVRDKAVNGQVNVTEIDSIIKDLMFLKQSTMIEIEKDGQTRTVDYHKANIEYIKKRIHCDVNNHDRRIRLLLSLPFEKHKIEPLGK
ncbi:MAG: hypothetical protein WC479_06175 [Candidatus Izemoplasmatales bacterium]